MPFEIDKNIASAKTLLAVELDSANLIISYGKMSKDKFDLENIAIFDITQNNSDEIALKIKQTIAVFKIKNTQVVNIIPNQYVITKNIEIPSIDPNEIKEIIDLQAGRHTPYSRNEIVMDYSEIGVIHGRYTKVLLAIVKREIVEEREKIIKSAGLKLAGVLLGAECLAQLIFEKYKEPDSDIPVFFVHIGGQNIDFIAAKNGILIYLRTAQIPLDIVLSNNPEQSQQFVAEVKKTIDLYCSEELSKQPEKIYFSGLINKDIIDNETLKAGLEGFRLRYIDRSDLFYLNNDTISVLSQYSDVSPFYVFSGMLTKNIAHLTLIPEDVRLKNQITNKAKKFTMMAILSMSILVMLALILGVKAFVRNIYLEKLTSSYRQENTEAERLMAIADRTGVMKRFLNKKGDLLTTIEEIFLILPEEVYLNTLDVREDETITFTATADSMSRVFSLVTNIENSKYFKNVTVDFTKSRVVKNGEVADFGLTLKIERDFEK